MSFVEIPVENAEHILEKRQEFEQYKYGRLVRLQETSLAQWKVNPSRHVPFSSTVRSHDRISPHRLAEELIASLFYSSIKPMLLNPNF